MFSDARIIARQSAAAGAMEVLATRHEIMFSDGMSVQLHPVHAHGLPMLTHRAIESPGGQLKLINLTRLVRSLDADLRTTQARDIPGVVFYTLRGAFKTAPQFVAAVERNAGGIWWPVAGGYVWHAAARAVDAEVLATTEMATLLPAPTQQITRWCPA